MVLVYKVAIKVSRSEIPWVQLRNDRRNFSNTAKKNFLNFYQNQQTKQHNLPPTNRKSFAQAATLRHQQAIVSLTLSLLKSDTTDAKNIALSEEFL